MDYSVADSDASKTIEWPGSAGAGSGRCQERQSGVKSGAYLRYFSGPLAGQRVRLGMP
jgi:hypothetical protein